MKTTFLAASAIIITLVVNLRAAADASGDPPLTIKVVDTEGRPVPGATVECYKQQHNRSIILFDLELQQRATTSANGTVVFKADRAGVLVLARKSGFAPVWRQWLQPLLGEVEEPVTLTSPTELRGTVVDEADQPVPDAEVWLVVGLCEARMDVNSTTFTYLGGKVARDLFSTRTASDGRFRLEGFPTNVTADLAVFKPGKTLRQLARPHLGPDTMHWHSGQPDVKLVLDPGSVLEGKIVVPQPGWTFTNVQVWLDNADQGSFSPCPPIQAKADGSFRFSEIAAHNYRIRTIFGADPLPPWAAETVAVSVELGQTVRDLQIPATKGGFLEVKVQGRINRQPLDGTEVSTSKMMYHTSSTANSNGVALFRLPPGEYSVNASSEKWQAASSRAKVEAGTTNRVEIELDPLPRITGVVKDPAGMPMAGLRLMVLPEHRFGGRGLQTDPNGRYEFNWNPRAYGSLDNNFCLMVLDPKRNLAVAQEINETTTTLDLQLEPSLVICGRVQTPDGQPLANATLTAHVWMGNMGTQFGNQPGKTDAQGRFEMTGFPKGRQYGLWANAKGYGSANQNVHENTETNRIEMPPFVLKIADRQIAGQVMDAEEKPVAGARVSMYGRDQPNNSTQTDAQGRFTFAQVCEGTVRAAVNHRGAYGDTQAQAGDTNLVIVVHDRSTVGPAASPQAVTLKGKALPDLSAADFGQETVVAGKPILLCLFDLDQRPSRRCLRLLAEKHAALRQQGIGVLAIHTTATTAEAFKTWKEANSSPFPVGWVREKSTKTRWLTSPASLPWLILTDANRRVAAEGFALEDLDATIKILPK
jgi:uncharacterized GH25 family protein